MKNTMKAVALNKVTYAKDIVLSEVEIPKVRPGVGIGKNQGFWNESFRTDFA
jgi:hypothetical protein